MSEDKDNTLQALSVNSWQGLSPALQNAIFLWANASTDVDSSRRRDLLRDKRNAVIAFFQNSGKRPSDVGPMDVKSWQASLEAQGLKAATVYSRISRLSSFYEWAMKDQALSQIIRGNPVSLARPKALPAYQSESTRSLDDQQLRALLSTVRAKAVSGDVIAKRDFALLLFYVLTGMRRSEVISLQGDDVDVKQDKLIIRCKVKGGDYVALELREPLVMSALQDYLTTCNRLHTLATGSPLWTRHDRAGKPGEALTSHAFVKNLKRYALEAGISKIHLHQIRHTYARIISEETGSIVDTQEALGHRNLSTTRVYVQRIAVKRDKHSERIKERVVI
jgi:site-specific recombinase XerD